MRWRVCFMDQRSPAAHEYRHLYKTARWQRVRAAHLVEEPLCRMCMARGLINDGSRKPDGSYQTEPRRRFLVCDHVEPHRGDVDRFYGGPFQTLCPDDHDKRKQAEELRGFANDVGLDGWPIDPAHPVNRRR